VTANAYHPGALQSNLMRQMPAMVRLLTWPVGRRPDRAAHALGDLTLEERYAQATGRFYKREKPAKAPKSSQDTTAQQRLWVECQRLLGHRLLMTPSHEHWRSAGGGLPRGQRGGML
jgi:hypothetical protein